MKDAAGALSGMASTIGSWSASLAGFQKDHPDIAKVIAGGAVGGGLLGAGVLGMTALNGLTSGFGLSGASTHLEVAAAHLEGAAAKIGAGSALTPRREDRGEVPWRGGGRSGDDGGHSWRECRGRGWRHRSRHRGERRDRLRPPQARRTRPTRLPIRCSRRRSRKRRQRPAAARRSLAAAISRRRRVRRATVAGVSIGVEDVKQDASEAKASIEAVGETKVAPQVDTSGLKAASAEADALLAKLKQVPTAAAAAFAAVGRAAAGPHERWHLRPRHRARRPHAFRTLTMAGYKQGQHSGRISAGGQRPQRGASWRREPRQAHP